MRITAITRYKHGELYAILQRLGWTQSELARQVGVGASIIGDVINLVKRPSVKLAEAIQVAVGAAGEYIDVLEAWPETFKGIARGYKLEQTADVEMENLIGCREAMMIPAPKVEDTEDLDSAISTLLVDIDPRGILKDRFWNKLTQEQVGKKRGMTASNVSYHENCLLNQLRRDPAIRRRLAPYLDE